MGRLVSLRPGRLAPVQAEPRAIDAPQMSPELPSKLLWARPGQVGAGGLQLVGAHHLDPNSDPTPWRITPITAALVGHKTYRA
jgi:hypothetical protein